MAEDTFKGERVFGARRPLRVFFLDSCGPTTAKLKFSSMFLEVVSLDKCATPSPLPGHATLKIDCDLCTKGGFTGKVKKGSKAAKGASLFVLVPMDNARCTI